MFTLNCPECNRAFEGANESNAKRALCTHRRLAHKILAANDQRKREVAARYYAANRERILARQRAKTAQSRAEAELRTVEAAPKHVPPSQTPEGKRSWYFANRERALARMKERRLALRRFEQGQTQTNGVPQAVPCKLSECPRCHTRFYMAIGGEGERIGYETNK